ETPTPLTDHKHKEKEMGEDNLTERLKLDAAKKEKQTSESPFSPSTPRVNLTKEDEKKKQKRVAPPSPVEVSIGREKKVEQKSDDRRLCAEH
ncbi:hypothetical protein PMAYCL1PPCAC_23472, partial [Pristionchus mayeri]